VTSDWKNAHANDANAFAEHELIEDVLTEFASNMGFERKGLPEYGLQKIVRYTAQVVLARARGIDPDRLRMTDDEWMESQRRLMNVFLEAGKPVTVTDGHMGAHIDPDLDRPARD
jgi:hypothetical protein